MDHSTANLEGLHDILLVEGYRFLQSGNVQEAEKRARQVLTQQPGNPKAYYLLACIAENAGLPEVALPYAR
ncbi:MAG: hypothetical protein KDD76_00680, partial [Rickettsiales bacterium]|nr:hypothetical protein [Rickettsiales bacterium]